MISLAEVTGMEGEIVTHSWDIFSFRKRGVLETGEVMGDFEPSGIRPKFAERLSISGIHLPASIFDVSHVL